MKSKVLSILLLLSTISSYAHVDVRHLDPDTIPVNIAQRSNSVVITLEVSNMKDDKVTLQVSPDGKEVVVYGHSKSSKYEPNDKNHSAYSKKFRTEFAKTLVAQELGFQVNLNINNKVYTSGKTEDDVSISCNSKNIHITIPTQTTTVTQN